MFITKICFFVASLCVILLPVAAQIDFNRKG